MIVLDRGKMTYLSHNTAAPFAQVRGYGSRINAYRTDDPFKQLRGLGCGNGCDGMSQYVHSTLGALGDAASALEKANQFNPEPISHAAINFALNVQDFFGIGAGRREADEIVPIQNQLVDSLIAPIAYAVNADFRMHLSVSQLQAMWDALLDAKDAWLEFLHNTEWVDGRAAQQAEQTLKPYFDDQQKKLMTLMETAPQVNYTGGGMPVIAGVPVLGLPPVKIPTGSASSFGSVLQQYAPYLLLGAFVFALPKIGKWQGKA